MALGGFYTCSQGCLRGTLGGSSLIAEACTGQESTNRDVAQQLYGTCGISEMVLTAQQHAGRAALQYAMICDMLNGCHSNKSQSSLSGTFDCAAGSFTSVSTWAVLGIAFATSLTVQFTLRASQGIHNVNRQPHITWHADIMVPARL